MSRVYEALTGAVYQKNPAKREVSANDKKSHGDLIVKLHPVVPTEPAFRKSPSLLNSPTSTEEIPHREQSEANPDHQEFTGHEQRDSEIAEIFTLICMRMAALLAAVSVIIIYLKRR